MDPVRKKRRLLAALGAVLMTAPLWPEGPKAAARFAIRTPEQKPKDEPAKETRVELPKDSDEALAESQERLRQAIKDMEAARQAPQHRFFPGQQPNIIIRGGGGMRIGDPVPPEFMERGRLGIRIQAVPDDLARDLKLPNDRGILVTDVVQGTPAEKAGFRPDDILMEFAGKKVNGDPSFLTEMVLALKGDEAYEAVVLRNGKEAKLAGIRLPGFGVRRRE